MLPLTETVFRKSIRHGSLSVIDAGGRRHEFGSGEGTRVCLRINDRASELLLMSDPDLRLGELYSDGRIVIEEGNIYELVAMLMQSDGEQTHALGRRLFSAGRYLARRLKQFNPAWRSARNVRHHYDVEREIYALFLDPAWQYSCAYFEDGNDSDVVAAQTAKMCHVTAKLHLDRPGREVLDIGCGWGGLSTYMAEQAGARVTGITLSPAQIQEARKRAWQRDLTGSIEFEERDYRDLDRRFDRIVSVGMFEHVGINHYGEFFSRIHDLLKNDGVAVIHSIGRSDGPGYTNPFIAKYIFPGGYFPALSEVLPSVEKAGLMVADVEILRLHYAKTLRSWRQRFVGRWDEAARIKGEKFCRAWEFYLAGAEAAFRYQGLMVFQLQLIRDVGALPITRDYMQAEEDRLRQAGNAASVLPMAGE